jgi:hypothetical protein
MMMKFRTLSTSKWYSTSTSNKHSKSITDPAQASRGGWRGSGGDGGGGEEEDGGRRGGGEEG